MRELVADDRVAGRHPIEVDLVEPGLGDVDHGRPHQEALLGRGRVDEALDPFGIGRAEAALDLVYPETVGVEEGLGLDLGDPAVVVECQALVLEHAAELAHDLGSGDLVADLAARGEEGETDAEGEDREQHGLGPRRVMPPCATPRGGEHGRGERHHEPELNQVVEAVEDEARVDLDHRVVERPLEVADEGVEDEDRRVAVDVGDVPGGPDEEQPEKHQRRTPAAPARSGPTREARADERREERREDRADREEADPREDVALAHEDAVHLEDDERQKRGQQRRGEAGAPRMGGWPAELEGARGGRRGGEAHGQR
ncbi:MAG TPA: hypothetical protein PK095_19730 [Myxococcota bacterium]|nr:hypothetical protein [Myxococcota bacterium]